MRALVTPTVLFCGAIIFGIGCGKKSGGGNDASNNTKAGSLALSNNSLAASYPEGLAVTVLPQAIDSKPGQAAPGTLVLGFTSSSHVLPFTSPAGVDFTEHPRQKLEETEKILNGEAEKCFDATILQALTMQNNTTDFCFGADYGIISGTLMGSGDQGQVNPTLQGATSTADAKSKLQAIVTTPNTSSEACMVGTSRSFVSQAVGRLDAALALFQGVLCQAKKDKVLEELPAVDVEADVASVFTNFPKDNANPATFTSAKIKRLADNDGRPVYRSSLTFDVTSGGSSKPFEIVLIHSPGAESNVTYDGLMYIKTTRPPEGASTKSFNSVTSVRYSKSGKTYEDSLLRLEARNADIMEDNSPLTSEGLVDMNSGAGADGSFPTNNANDYISNIRFFGFEVNPSSYAGKVTFWTNPGGNYTEPARGFVFETTQNTDGTLAGCAYAGAKLSTSIRKTLKDGGTLTPDGCFTPQLLNGACGAPGDNMGTNIWMQCFAQDTNGIYKIDTSKVDDDAAGFDIKQASGVTVPTLNFSTLKTFGSVL